MDQHNNPDATGSESRNEMTMKRFRRLLIYVLLLAVVFAAIAFSAKQFSQPQLTAREVSIHGTVTRDGQPLQWKGANPKLWVIFQQTGAPATLTDTHFADCDSATGTFSIAIIPLGKYQGSIRPI